MLLELCIILGFMLEPTRPNLLRWTTQNVIQPVGAHHKQFDFKIFTIFRNDLQETSTFTGFKQPFYQSKDAILQRRMLIWLIRVISATWRQGSSQDFRNKENFQNFISFM